MLVCLSVCVCPSVRLHLSCPVLSMIGGQLTWSWDRRRSLLLHSSVSERPGGAGILGSGAGLSSGSGCSFCACQIALPCKGRNLEGASPCLGVTGRGATCRPPCHTPAANLLSFLPFWGRACSSSPHPGNASPKSKLPGTPFESKPPDGHDLHPQFELPSVPPVPKA